ncbi:MAG: integrase core domain-containing protein [Solirubrobacteraceae bacterium]
MERFFGTLDTEWAHSRTWPDSATRDRALSSFVRFYNRRRPYTAANGHAPSLAFSTSASRTSRR